MTSGTCIRNLVMSGGSKFLVLILVALFLAPSLVIALPVHASPSWNVQIVDENGWDLSTPDSFPIAVDSHNNPHIAYTDVENAGSRSPPKEIYPIKYASWTGSSWVIQNVSQGRIYSLVLDSHNNPHITFEDNGVINAYRTGTNWTIQTVATSQPFSQSYVSLALDSNNLPHIAYYVSEEVKLAVYNNSHWNIQTVASNVTSLGNMVLDSNGYPHLIYTINDVYFPRYEAAVLVYDSWNGTSWNAQNVTSTLNTGNAFEGFLNSASLALNSSGYPQIAYVNASAAATVSGARAWGFFAYASWTGESWVIQTVNSKVNVESCYLAVDSKGNPHVSLVGVYAESAAAEEAGAYAYVASVLYAPAESSPVFGNIATFLIILAVAVIVIIAVSLLLFRRHRKIQQVKKH